MGSFLMARPKHPRQPPDVDAARLLVEEAVGRAVRAPAFSYSAPGDAERVATGNTGRVLTSRVTFTRTAVNVVARVLAIRDALKFSPERCAKLIQSID